MEEKLARLFCFDRDSVDRLETEWEREGNDNWQMGLSQNVT